MNLSGTLNSHPNYLCRFTVRLPGSLFLKIVRYIITAAEVGVLSLPTVASTYISVSAQYLFCSSLLAPAGTGILTRCPSTTPFGFALGPTNPQLISIAGESRVFPVCRFLTCIVVTYAYIFFLYAQKTSQFTFNAIECSTHSFNATASVICLCPIIIHARPLD